MIRSRNRRAVEHLCTSLTSALRHGGRVALACHTGARSREINVMHRLARPTAGSSAGHLASRARRVRRGTPARGHSWRTPISIPPRHFGGPVNKRWYISLSLVAALLLAGGFLLDYRSFTGNVLSELSGIVISAVLAVLIFERIAERERRRRWEEVRGQLHRVLYRMLTDIAFEVYIALPVEVRKGNRDVITMMVVADDVTSDVVSSAAELRDMVQVNIGALVAIDEDDEYSRSRSTYDSLMPSVNRIRDTLVPQFLQLGQDPQLIVALSGIERAVQVWEWNLKMNELYGGPSAWDGVVGVLDSVHKVLRHIPARSVAQSA